MRFLMMQRSNESGAPPSPEHMETMEKFVKESFRKGILLDTGGLMPTFMAARVKLDNGKVAITDGPFTEAKEIVGGFAIVQANSMKDAIQMASDFIQVAGEGECEVRQIAEAGDPHPLA